MAKEKNPAGLSRRETQIMDILFKQGSASVGDVWERLPEAPSTTAVRTLLGLLVKKGLVRSRSEGTRKIYRPVDSRRRAGRSALHRVLDVFYDGSLASALEAHFGDSGRGLSSEDHRELAELIRKAKQVEEGGGTP